MASMIMQKACPISSSSSSSSSSSASRGNYDVFLSFYGKDTRKNFTDHLYAALKQKGINAFRDEEKLERGTFIAPELMEAIEGSKYAIVVLSENYAFSKWCLDELVKILECMKEKGLKVLPIFYYVDPSDVGKQEKTFGEAFLEHEKDPKLSIKIQRWRAALTEVGKIAGWHLDDSYESKDVQEITEKIHIELFRELSMALEHLVGIDSCVEEIMELFGELDDVRSIGIWGMAGIGKTTLASVIYEKNRHQFDACSFIRDVREIAQKNGLVYLQQKLLSDILNEKEVNIQDYLVGIQAIRKNVLKKKLLIIIDDVDDYEQLQALAIPSRRDWFGPRDWFGLGSRIIITSRDKQLLARHCLIYPAKRLDDDEALELFSWKAFEKPFPEEDYLELSKAFVEYAKGLPLALAVLGSSLFDKPKDAWESSWDKLKGNPEPKIFDKLKIGFDGLKKMHQKLFLDIAFFFKGEDKDRLADILEVDYDYKNGIDTLQKKSLIVILGRKVLMHDLLQEMGWEIVRCEPQLGRRSRLLICDDVLHVLKTETGTESVEGIKLSLPPHEKEELEPETFSMMTRLRLLIIHNLHLSRDLSYLSNELRLLQWNEYPLKSMPERFQPKKLVELIMHHSSIEQLPKGFSNLQELKLIDLSYSQDLKETPNFIGFSKLERLIFQGCISLCELHPSVGALKRLTLLNLKECKRLNCLPPEINLESLENFILSGCSKLKKFSEIGTNMTRLSELYLDGTAVEEMPLSIKHLSSLTLLSLQDCKNLSSFPSVNLPSLKTLILSGRKVQTPKSWLLQGLSLIRAPYVFLKDYFFPIQEAVNLLLPRFRFIASLNLTDSNLWDGALPDDLSCLSSLQDLDLSRNNFTHLPDSISQLSKLKCLTLNDCSRLQSLPHDLCCLSSLQDLDLSRNNFTHLPDSISQLSNLKRLKLNDCSRLQSLPVLPLSIGFLTIRRCPLLENYSNQFVAWPSRETGFTLVNSDGRDSALCLLPSSPYGHCEAFIERFIEESIHQNKSLPIFSNSTEIPEWFSHQSPGSSVTIPLPSDLRDNSSWEGIALFVVVVIHKNLNNISSGQDYEVCIDFICRSGMVEGLLDCPLVINMSKALPKPLYCYSSFGFRVINPAGKLRDHLEECGCIVASITSNHPYLEIKMCAARILYRQNLVEFLLAEGKIDKRSQCQVDKMETSKSNGQSDSNVGLKRKLKSLLLRLYQGDLARNRKYDYVFPHMTVPNWFSYQSFCPYIRVKLPENWQYDVRWMGIAVCAYYTVHKQPAVSSDNQDLTSFLHFYNASASHRVRLIRYKIFRDSKDIFDESSHRILVFYIPRLLLRLEECRHIGASFEHKNPGVQFIECGIRLVYEEDVEEFVQTLVQCMLRSSVAYHEFFYQNLSHQVEEMVAGFDNRKDVGCSSSLQRIPQPMPKLLPSIENIAKGCTYPGTFSNMAGTSRNFSPSFTGLLIPARKGQHASIMSSESLIKAYLQKNFEEGEIFNCCFAEREIPRWFGSQSNMDSMKAHLSADNCNNDPDWMGCALCGLFEFYEHPTVVRMNLGSKRVRMFKFSCLLRTNSCHERLVCDGLLTEDNELVTLNQRAFIWLLFIPRMKLAHLWSQSTRDVAFWFESSIPYLSVEKIVIKLVNQKNMEEFTRMMVQCSAPFDSILDSCDQKLFYDSCPDYPEVCIGTKSSYEDLHPQRLFISQEEASGTSHYSYEEDPFPHHHFRYFHPSTPYNSSFPTRRTPLWFNHHSRGHSVTIDIPPNLFDDCNWLGLALYASFLIPWDREKSVSSINSSHFLYCRFQTSNAGLDDQILVFRTTDEENEWLLGHGLIWISYIPGEAFKDMLHQGGCIEASFVSNCPGVTVLKCGLRLLYQHDQVQFEQELKHCNAFISAHRDFSRRLSLRPTRFEKFEEVHQVIKNFWTILRDQKDRLDFDGCSKYSYCSPPVEILHWFKHNSNEPSVTIDISTNLYNDGEWKGLALCAYFSIDDHQPFENPSSAISHHLICLLETNVVGQKPVLHVHRTAKEEYTWLDTDGGFLWLSYIPRQSFPDQFSQYSYIEASIISDWPGVIVQKCGFSFYNVHDNWFWQARDNCNQQYVQRNFKERLTTKYIEETYRAKNHLYEDDPHSNDQCCQSDPQSFDRGFVYNSCFPPIKIPHWFEVWRDKPKVTFRLSRKWYNRDTRMGLALCALFEVHKDVTDVDYIVNSKNSYSLICHLENKIGSVKPRHIYWPTQQHLMLSQLGGFIWLSYIPYRSFPDWLYDCDYVTVSFTTNCFGLTAQKCGLRPLFRHDDEEGFKKIINDCKNSVPDVSLRINQMKIENRERKRRSWIENELRRIDPHPMRDFEVGIFYNACCPPSGIFEWCSHRSDVPRVTIPLPPNLYNDSTWMGLVLCTTFAVHVDKITDILNSKVPFDLRCELKTHAGRVGTVWVCRLTKEDIMELQRGGFIWLFYIGRELLQTFLDQCSCFKTSFSTDCPCFKVQKCGLRLMYRNDVEEFKQTIGNWLNQVLDDEETSSRASSSSDLRGIRLVWRLFFPHFPHVTL